MTSFVFVRRFLADYARNPVNLLLLVVVPTVFVVVVAGSLADAAKLVGGVGGPAVETATAGWAAAFLAGIAMYFQTAATRDTDRRIVIAGLPPGHLVGARLITGMVLAVLASAAALVALAARTGIDHPGRAVLGTLMFAIIYVAIGAVVGSLAGNPVNGTVIVLFVWILEVFFGPAMGATDRLATRGLPTHFVTAAGSATWVGPCCGLRSRSAPPGCWPRPAPGRCTRAPDAVTRADSGGRWPPPAGPPGATPGATASSGCCSWSSPLCSSSPLTQSRRTSRSP